MKIKYIIILFIVLTEVACAPTVSAENTSIPPQVKTDLSITLSQEKWSMVLAGLTKLPYEVSAPLIQEIQNQATMQMRPPVEKKK